MAGGEIGGQQVAFGRQAEPRGRHVLVAPAVVGPKPRRAEVFIAGQQILKPAIEAQGDAGAGVVVGDESAADFDAPERPTAREDAIDAGGELFRHETGQLGGGADAAEESREGTLHARILVEKDADEALATENF